MQQVDQGVCGTAMFSVPKLERVDVDNSWSFLSSNESVRNGLRS